MERIEELLVCPVCADRFKEPKVLPCQHTFCLRPCLENILHDNSVRCPICRACHNLPRNGVEGLPSNLTIVNLLDFPNQQRLLRQCKGCEMESGDVAMCKHCDESLCKSCIARHTGDLQQDLHHSLIQVTRLVSKIAESDFDLRERAKNLEENGRKVKREISQSIERFISELQSRKKCLVDEVDALVATETGSLLRDQQELEVKMTSLTTHRQVSSEICKRPLTLESTHEIQQFQSEILCLAQRGRELLQSNAISSDKVRQTIKITNRDENVVLSAISNFCTVSAQAPLTFEDELASDGGPRVRRTSGRRERNSQSSGDDGRVTEALCQYRNKGQVKRYFGAEGNGVGQMKCPHGITSTAADDIVVADNENNRIQIFDVNGQVKGVIGSKGTLEGQFNRVDDVCVTPRGLIVASDLCNHRIQIFDEHGRFVQKFGSRGSGDGELIYPQGVATDDKGLIYVCDGSNHRVQVFSPSGNFVRKFGTEENRLEYPKFLCLTSNGRVVVSELRKHRVQVFDSYGRHLFQFGTEGTSESQFNKPRGVITDQHGNIIVSDKDNHRVQVFTKDGAFVSCFGSEGSEPGEMKEPQGVCLLSDGGIAISEGVNTRVQIF